MRWRRPLSFCSTIPSPSLSDGIKWSMRRFICSTSHPSPPLPLSLSQMIFSELLLSNYSDQVKSLINHFSSLRMHNRIFVAATQWLVVIHWILFSLLPFTLKHESIATFPFPVTEICVAVMDVIFLAVLMSFCVNELALGISVVNVMK